MAKAYDRVYWFFLIKVMRKMGFSNVVVNVIWRLISNNYYSKLLNGLGFFYSTSGEIRKPFISYLDNIVI